MRKKKIIQWSIMTALCVWGFIAFMILAGEESPTSNLTLGQFLFIKIGALGHLALCIIIGKWLNKKGLLPEMKDKEV